MERNSPEYLYKKKEGKEFTLVFVGSAILTGSWLYLAFGIEKIESSTVSIKLSIILSTITVATGAYCFRALFSAYQSKKGMALTFDRPCPEYITHPALVVAVIALLWPI
jgi:hypothetical protein